LPGIVSWPVLLTVKYNNGWGEVMKKSCKFLLSALGLSLLSAMPTVAQADGNAVGGIAPWTGDSSVRVICALKITGLTAATASKMILPCPATVLYETDQQVCAGTSPGGAVSEGTTSSRSDSVTTGIAGCPVFTNGPTPLDPVTEGRYLSKTCSITPTKIGGSCDYQLPIYDNELLSVAYTDKIALPVAKGLACRYASEPVVKVVHSSMRSADVAGAVSPVVGSVMIAHNIVCSKVVPNKK